MKARQPYSLKQTILHNPQQRLLYRIQQLTTEHTVRQCTCIPELDQDLSIMGVVVFPKPFFFRNIKTYRHVIQSENYKT